MLKSRISLAHGAVILPLPPKVLNQMKWKLGDDIMIDINIHGDVVLSKKE